MANAGAQRDLSVSHERLGDIHLRLGESDKALTAYGASLEIRQKLAQQDPDNAGAQRDLSVSHSKLGDIHLRLGESDKALAAYGASLDIRQKQAQQDPDNVGAQRDLFVSYVKMYQIFASQQQFGQALGYIEKARDQLLKMDKNHTIIADDRQYIEVFNGIIAELKKTLAER